MKKNDMAIIIIEDMSENGEGIGKANGYTLFVKDTVIGDKAEVKVIRAKKGYGYGKLLKLISPSFCRVRPVCPAAASCGGCQLQAMSYEEQLRFKENKVKNHLARIGGFTNIRVLPAVGMEDPFHYRNKAQYPVAGDKDGNIRMGFYAGRTHSVIETSHCYIGDPANSRILELVKSYMRQEHILPYDETAHTGLVRHVLIRRAAATGQIMVCLIINGSRLPAAGVLTRSLLSVEGMTAICLNINQERTNVILGKQTIILHGPGYITDWIGDISFRISPQSFFQVNSVQTKILYEKVLEYAGLTGTETVWDLYCGIGTISLLLAGKAKQVYGVEVVEQAVKNARENAARNHIRNAEFFMGRAEEILPDLCRTRQITADLIVIDPPRKGCVQSLLDTIARMQPEKVIYVSCDSATLARDLEYLCRYGYELGPVQPVDMFPMTVGVETCVLLSRKKAGNKSTRIEIDIDLDEADRRECIGKATYQEIKDYIWEHYQAKVSHLYIAQVKQKCGIIERENFNKAKTEGNRVPNCSPEKERMIREALKYYGMIK